MGYVSFIQNDQAHIPISQAAAWQDPVAAEQEINAWLSDRHGGNVHARGIWNDHNYAYEQTLKHIFSLGVRRYAVVRQAAWHGV